jgi:pilus assembly protein CpaE
MNPTEPTKGAGGDAQGDGLSAMPPLSMVTIALNRETQGLLRLYLSSLPLNLRVELADYGPNEVEEIPEWLGGEPEICIVDFDTEPDKASACAETIRSHNPEIAIFGVSSNAKPEAIVEAMRSGCNEYLLKPLTREQLAQAVARIGSRHRDRKEQPSASQVLTFVGAKGGCGTTALATQLGAILAHAHAKKTLLVDLHPGLGDAALYMGFPNHRYHAFELLDNADRMDAALLQNLVLHHASGLDIVPAPEDFDANRRIAPAAVAQLFSFLRLRYDIVLVDAPYGLSEQILRLIPHSDFIYLITVAEVAALRNVTRMLDAMAKSDVSADRIRVVLNRFDKRSPIPEAQIEKVIRQKIFWSVPNQYFQAVKAVTGTESLASLMRSDLMRNLGGWADLIGGKAESQAVKKKRGLMGLFGVAE